MHEPTGTLLKNAPQVLLQPGQWYSRSASYMPPLQAAWMQGRCEPMWLGTMQAQVDGRRFLTYRIITFVASASLAKQNEACIYFRNFITVIEVNFSLAV